MYVGIDPGSKCSGFAAVEGGRVLAVAAIAACDEEHECACLAQDLPAIVGWRGLVAFRFAVEGQEYRHAKAKGSPNDQFKLAHAAGAAFAVLSRLPAAEAGQFVVPSKWKGTVPKLPHHRRLLTKLGWSWEERGTGKGAYCAVTSPLVIHNIGTITKTQWPEVLDAIGIALWLEEKHRGR